MVDSTEFRQKKPGNLIKMRKEGDNLIISQRLIGYDIQLDITDDLKRWLWANLFNRL